jgi:hypothetical protein
MWKTLRSFLLEKLPEWLANRYPRVTDYYHLFVSDRWLIPGLFCAFLMVSTCAVATLKLWRTTPDGFKPVIKVSMIDRIQGWSLYRSAGQSVAKQDFYLANIAYRLAAANDPGNPDYFRKYLEVMQHEQSSSTLGAECFRYGSWLLRLTQTNQTDLDLFVSTMEHCRQYSDISRLLETKIETRASVQYSAYMRGLFHLGSYHAFRDLWPKTAEPLASDPLLAIYAQAVTVILDKQTADIAALQALYAPIEPSSPIFLRSRQVALQTYADTGDKHQCQHILNDLVEEGLASVQDYLIYWDLLIRLGSQEEIDFQASEIGEPASEVEAITLANILRLIGKKDASNKVAEAALFVFGDRSLNIWINYGHMISSDRSWGDLQTLAQRAHAFELSMEITPLIRYWEALIAWNMDRPERALKIFDALVDAPPRSGLLRLHMARGLLAVDQAAADSLVKGMNGTAEGVQLYWQQRSKETSSIGDLEGFTRVSTLAYESNPGDVTHMSNLSAALLLQRNEPEKAHEFVKLLKLSNPGFMPFRLNLAHSLIQVGQIQSADEELQSIAISKELEGPILEGDYRLALFELAVARNSSEEIVTRYRELRTDHLFPETVQWIETAAASHLENRK